jgi:glutathione S-transferase
MTAAALEVELNLKTLNIMEKEHLEPEFIEINPQHTIPTLVDGEFVLWESRAICVYLIEKYGGDENQLYPSEVETKALINHRLFFDMGTLFPGFQEYYAAPLLGKEQTPENFAKLEKSIKLLNGFLEKTGFVAETEAMSVADIVIFATTSTIEVAGFDFSDYPKVGEWLQMMKENCPGLEANEEGLNMLSAFFNK